MLTRIRHRIFQRLQLKESWVIFFIMGIIMMNFPFLNIFNKSDTLFGFPLIFLYLMGGWAFSIFITYLFTLAIRQSADVHQETKEP